MRFSAVLLAGGKSSRMGSDKAFLEIEGEPLWQRQLATLRGLSPGQLMISGPRREEWDEYEIVTDEFAGSAGRFVMSGSPPSDVAQSREFGATMRTSYWIAATSR